MADPGRDTVLEAVRQLAPEFSARAVEGERLRTMPPDLVERVGSAGLFRLFRPRSLGGLELDPFTMVEVIEELSRADGSGGWTVMIGNSTAFFAWLDPAVAAAMIGDDHDFASTSTWAPLGVAVPDGEGAFRVSGRWPFNSGCPHAAWFQVGVLVMDGESPRQRAGGGPDWRLAFVPHAGAEIENTWDAAGLRGTGSHHLTISDRQVPAEHLISPFFEPPRHDGPLWRIPFVASATLLMAGFPLGVARRALDEFTEIARAKVRGEATETIAQDGSAQVELARAEAGLLAARAFIFEAIGEVWDTACKGDPPSLDQRGRMLLAMSHAMRASVDATDRVFRLAGAAALFSDQPLQRCFRDLHAAGQHIIFSTDRDRSFAKLRFGIEQPTFMI